MVYPQLLSDCCLSEQRVYEPDPEWVCVSEAEGGDPTPPPRDCASLTGWRGRWGHCNKANTHTHTFSTLVMSSLFWLFPASTLPSFCFFPRLALLLLFSHTSSRYCCLVLLLNPNSTLPLLFIAVPLSRSLFSHCTVIFMCAGVAHMLLLAGGPQPAQLHVSVCVRVGL